MVTSHNFCLSTHCYSHDDDDGGEDDDADDDYNDGGEDGDGDDDDTRSSHPPPHRAPRLPRRGRGGLRRPRAAARTGCGKYPPKPLLP